MPAAVLTPVPGQKAYEPHGAALTLFYDFSPEIILAGPADTGKSRAILERMFQLCETYPNVRMLMTRKTRASLTESAMVTFEQKVVPERHPVLIGPQREQRHSYKFPNGSEIVTGGLGDQAEKTRVMSTEYDWIYVQEAREIGESEWEELSTRCSGRAGNLPFHQLVGDTNPDTPGHWIKRRADRGKLKFLESQHADNPSITPDRLAVLQALTGMRRDRLYLGRWVGNEGIIYDNWKRSVHVQKPRPIPANWQRFLSIDFGYSGVLCIQWWAMDGDGRLHRYRELYRRGLVMDDAAHLVRKLSTGEKIMAIICDHDAGERALLERHLSCHCPEAAGSNAIHCSTTPAKKDVIPGIQLVHNRLDVAGDGLPRLTFLEGALESRDEELERLKLPTCTEEEVEFYIWAPSAGLLNPDGTARKEEPVKKDDHGLDATRYMVAYFDLKDPRDALYGQAHGLNYGGHAKPNMNPDVPMDFEHKGTKLLLPKVDWDRV